MTLLLKKIYFLAVFMLAFGSCQESEKKTNENNNDTAKITQKDDKPETKKEKPQPIDRKYNDMARFIAGMSPEEGSEYAKYSENAGWKQYAAAAENQWKNIREKKLPKLIQWTGKELQEPNQEKGILFYPFSGPDFLHAAIFFPEADETVMIGLEPIGSLPDFDKIAKKSLSYYFNGIQRTLGSILNFSFFRTLSMEVDLTGRVSPDIDGTLPVLMLFLARTNHKLLYYEKVALSPEGKIISAADIKIEKGKKDDRYYGTKIAYQRNDKPEERKNLYYFGVNLSNDPYVGKGGLNQRNDLRKYLENLDFKTTYLKSASYLMYKPYFSKIKEIILKKTKYLLQDDSGMALNNFKEDTWQLTFFGRYAGPIKLFANYWQKDMQVAFQKKEQVRALPFGIGYQYIEGSSNLMLAKRK